VPVLAAVKRRQARYKLPLHGVVSETPDVEGCSSENNSERSERGSPKLAAYQHRPGHQLPMFYEGLRLVGENAKGPVRMQLIVMAVPRSPCGAVPIVYGVHRYLPAAPAPSEHLPYAVGG
jgi:hypothetical protein